jgi:hypothetical protein
MNSLVDKDIGNRMDQESHYLDGNEGIPKVVKNSKEQIIECMQKSKLNES